MPLELKREPLMAVEDLVVPDPPVGRDIFRLDGIVLNPAKAIVVNVHVAAQLVGQGRVEEMDAVERVLHRAVLDFKVPGNAMPQKKGAVIGSRPPASRDGFVSMDTLPIGVPPEAMPRGVLEPRASIEQEPACALPRRVDGLRGGLDRQIAKAKMRTVPPAHG